MQTIAFENQINGSYIKLYNPDPDNYKGDNKSYERAIKKADKRIEEWIKLCRKQYN